MYYMSVCLENRGPASSVGHHAAWLGVPGRKASGGLAGAAPAVRAPLLLRQECRADIASQLSQGTVQS
jgi:hypothetical protein